MEIAIFLAFKDSMKALKNAGQDERFTNYYLKEYAKDFEKIYIFSWTNEQYSFGLDNVIFIPNSRNINSYLYGLLLPFLHRNIFKKTQILRLMQFTAIIPATLSKILFKNKIVATYGYPYSDFFITKKRYIKDFFWRIVQMMTINSVDKMIVTYPKLREYILKSGFRNKVVIIPNSVLLSDFSFVLKNKKEVTNILFIGRFEIEKNIENLAIAVAEIKDSINLTLIGHGNLENKIRKILDENHAQYKIISNLPHRDLKVQYQQADIFVLPSFNEGYPKVLIEAMSCGTPCIVAKYSGVEDIIKDYENGLLCNFDKDSIKNKILELVLDQQLRDKISKNARQFVEENNDITRNIQIEISEIKSP